MFTEHVSTGDNVVSTLEESSDRWRVDVYFGDNVDRLGLRRVIADIAGAAAAETLTFEEIAETDWIAASLAALTPVHAGRFVVHGAHDRARVAKSAIRIEIEAALAFGTGHHGTTKGCLLALDRLAKATKSRRGDGRRRRRAAILDLGAGSGVLAIAAAKRWRTGVLASDIDPVATRAAHSNARLNAVGPYVTTLCANGVTSSRIRDGATFGLVFANILLAPLKQLAAPLCALLAPGAHLILSGLLTSHANAAAAVYAALGLRLERRIVLDGWTTLVMRRPGRR